MIWTPVLKVRRRCKFHGLTSEDRVKKLHSRAKYTLKAYKCFIHGIPDREQKKEPEDTPIPAREEKAEDIQAMAHRSLICDNDDEKGHSLAASAASEDTVRS